MLMEQLCDVPDCASTSKGSRVLKKRGPCKTSQAEVTANAKPKMSGYKTDSYISIGSTSSLRVNQECLLQVFDRVLVAVLTTYVTTSCVLTTGLLRICFSPCVPS